MVRGFRGIVVEVHRARGGACAAIEIVGELHERGSGRFRIGIAEPSTPARVVVTFPARFEREIVAAWRSGDVLEILVEDDAIFFAQPA